MRLLVYVFIPVFVGVCLHVCSFDLVFVCSCVRLVRLFVCSLVRAALLCVRLRVRELYCLFVSVYMLIVCVCVVRVVFVSLFV